MENHTNRRILNFNYVLFSLLVFWVAIHVPGLLHGTGNLPLHGTFIGDEQVSVNSALRIFNEKNIFAFRNREMQYYGPLLVVVDSPGILADFALKYINGEVQTPEQYRNSILWDWTGILINIRITAMLSMLLGLLVVYQLVRTESFNMNRLGYMPHIALVLVAFNYYYFEFSHFSLHWAYIIPLLLAQYYTLIRINETRGNEVKFWIWHGLATVASFGISYFSVIFLSMWIPLLLKWARQNEWKQLRLFMVLILWLSAGFTLLILWHPYAFIRYLGFLGLGETVNALGGAQNPLLFTVESVSFYVQMIVRNHLALILATLIMLPSLIKRKNIDWYLIFIFLLPGIANFVLFAPAEHYEGRYMLPTIISLLVTFIYLLSRYIASGVNLRNHFSFIVLALLLWQICFHSIHIFRWAYIFGSDHAEQQTVKAILDLQSKTGGPYLVIDWYLFNYPHTPSSYKTFQQKRGFHDSPLYAAMFEHAPDSTINLLDLRYVYLEDIIRNPSLLQGYPYYIVTHIPSMSKGWTQFTYFDGDLIRNWWHKEALPSFAIYRNPYWSGESGEEGGKQEVPPSTARTLAEASTVYDLLKLREDFQCTFSVEGITWTTNGSIYSNSGRFLVNMDTKEKRRGTFVTRHMLLADGYYFFWNTGNPVGTKMSESFWPTLEGAPSVPTLPIGMRQTLPLVCEPSEVPTSMFMLPPSVSFTEVDPNSDILL